MKFKSYICIFFLLHCSISVGQYIPIWPYQSYKSEKFVSFDQASIERFQQIYEYAATKNEDGIQMANQLLRVELKKNGFVILDKALESPSTITIKKVVVACFIIIYMVKCNQQIL